VQSLTKILAIVLPLGTVAFSADLFRRAGFLFYPEQFFAAMFGLAMTLAYLYVPASPGRERKGPVPWYDAVAALLSLLAGAHLAVRYPYLTERVADLPAEGTVTAVVLAVLTVEALRRTGGLAITIVVVAFLGLALIADLLPDPMTGRPVPVDRLFYYLVWDSTAVLGTPLLIISTIVVCFILFGQALFLSGGSAYFTDVSMVLMGRFRGGPAKIAIVASSLFGTISGSVVANVVSTGVVTIPLMKNSGYRPHVAGAIEAVASTGGQLMPPVMGIAAFIMAEFLQVPYAEVAIAATIPAVLYYVALFVEADLEAARHGISRVPKERIPPAWEVIKSGWHYPIPFAVLILGIFSWNLPIDEAALNSLAVVIVFALVFGYRGTRLKLSGVLDIVRTTGTAVLDIFMIGAGAGMVIGVLNITGLGFGLTLSLVQIAGGDMLTLLFLAAVASIILGMGMPTVGVYILLATLVAPALIEMKIDPMAAHMFIMYYGMLSMITPPVCVGAFAAASIAVADPMRTGYTAMRFGWVAFILPFLFVFEGTLLFQGEPVAIVIDVVAAIAGVWLASAAMIGYGIRPLGIVSRLLYAISGLALVVPIGAFGGGRLVNFGGFGLAVALVGAEFMMLRRRAPARAVEPSSAE
jgi:TRAP transporter 4TM/12TM fusion protein